MSSDIQVLPACQKCKLRKVKCDRQAPKCTSCTKGKVACIIVDPVTGEQYARDYIKRLEEQEAELKAKLGERAGEHASERGEASQGSTTTSEAAETSPAAPHSGPPTGPPTGGTTASRSGFVGDGSGLGFLHSILSEAKWQRHRTRILHQLATRPSIQKLHLTPNTLPALQEGEQLLENYFTRFHIHHTFLLRQEVLSIFSRVYESSTACSDQDHFRLLMVFAISATTRYRAGISNEHPYGYFMAAENYLGKIPLIKDIDAIQNLLLVARFGMYHHIGTSLWEISQLCMRQCIEWQLQMRPSQALDPLTEQHRRRIFWECYVLDRYSSGILGRPFAIAESDIDVPLPFDANDEYIISAGMCSLDSIPPSMAKPTEVSVFIFCIHLRHISSRVHSTFYTGRSSAAPGAASGTILPEFKSVGHVYSAFAQYRKELRDWRSTAPIFPSPRSLYERAEWHDFLLEKDLLLLARGAMHNIPSRPYAGAAVKEILIACYVSASRIIELYADLMDKRAITWTRSYFQVIFTAGLTVTFCVRLADTEIHQRDPVKTLDVCSGILSFFKDKMPDAGSAAVVFDVLKDECLKDKSHPMNPTTAAAVPMNASTAHTNQLPSDASSHEVHQAYNAAFEALSHDNNELNLNMDHFNMNYALDSQELSLDLTDDLMMQLEAGLGEYAWGSIPTDGNFWDQMPFNY
ncbi:hypothetical protein HBI56_177600 [Parastagonospora nodorum]|uniref:Zn(2)-C6 fungal-type domain-containing protein n=1 Tax=Phaeosphaeria nodorum (strain SN15 / ATCC MYA-4574 / FGSC 10173) TaxID=321614 RepID=A0A7U2EWV5_PHANO|nr:hypothetical protein HBH56_047710 [Parastagonospora nodorum]QRC92510.1 hypothetical protein JI435_084220 [Parastagonospora nodorum SN15]KAH3933188.1 hypothetical protein HBH54_075450 [Parastagonospora nodorum]KAH3938863.1 hypothetical protein HBH53_244140 [Parastagonospora nodorum]KAH3973164.1 hypothetical protein HBH52_147500 [Parastagonospora nodorum]